MRREIKQKHEPEDTLVKPGIPILEMMPPGWTNFLPQRMGMSICSIRNIARDQNTDHPKYSMILDAIEEYKQIRISNRQRTKVIEDFYYKQQEIWPQEQQRKSA